MNRTFKSNRQGITLLFVVSMIVLFLLLGTAFVVVANNFNRESTRRIRSNQPEGKGELQGNQLIEEAMFQVIRGTDLRDIDSPLRTNEILADQYGYGVRAFVSPSTVANAAPAFIGGRAFIQFALTSDRDAVDTDAPDNMCFDLRTLSTTAQPLSPDGLNGTFGGRVLSFVSGPAKGFSARIMADAFTSSPNGILRFRIPTISVSGDSITTTNLAGSEVIINGRDFSGVGADAVIVAGQPTSLGVESQRPNRLRQSHNDLMSTYLNSSNSVNEPWDAADIATPFLSGFDASGNLIPSFYRLALITNGTSSPSGSTSFHAFDEGNDEIPDVDTDGDGVPDSFWMDLGVAVATNAQGQRFRPLFAIHIRDLDGLLNVNAHSNRTHIRPDGFVATSEAWAGTVPTTPRGLGMGTPEINLTNGIGGAGNLDALLNSRYGADMTPGDGPSFRSLAKLFGHPAAEVNNGGTIGNLYGTAMDIHGRFRIGTPATTNEFLNAATFNSSLPQIDILTTLDINRFTTEFSGNAYEMSLTGEAPGDAPFTLEELESVLRPNDIDSIALPNRLSNLLNSAVNTRLFTTDSFDVPMLYGSFVEELDRLLALRGVTNRQTLINNTLVQATQRAFAPELYFGLKMDINRPFGDGADNNNNNVVDEPGEEVLAENPNAATIFGNMAAAAETQMDLNFTGSQNNNDLPNNNPRDIYARNLYMLAMLLLDPIDLDASGTVDAADAPLFAEAIAQWAVNVVDFRDPDSIHTRFVYDPQPFDSNGWNPQFTGSAVGAAPPFVVWGCERPELLITELLAGHNRNTEDLAAGGGTVGGGGGGGASDTNNDFDQRLRPETFAYFEVYNPWVQNSLNQTFDGALYNGQGVELTRINPSGTPVWRFEIERVETPGPPKPLRYVYMADPTGGNITYSDQDENQTPADIEVFSPGTANTVNIEPGTHAVIGTRGFADGANEFRTFLGRRKGVTDAAATLDTTTHLSLNQNAQTLTRYNAISDMSETRNNTEIVFIDQAAQIGAGGMVDAGTMATRQFSLSDPYSGYDAVGLAPIMNGDGSVYTPTRDQPLDRAGQTDMNRDDNDLSKILVTNGVSQDFRTIRLQRLANPLLAWNQITNPYLTIDSMDADLITYNGVHDPNVVAEPGLGAPGSGGAVSHERGSGTGVERNLWSAKRSATTAPGTVGDATHNFDQDLVESLGKTNDEYLTGTQTFPWLTWNNRPFVSHTEIMNVPYLAPDQLTYAQETVNSATFSIDDGAVNDPYTNQRTGAGEEVLAGRYGHLLNFFASDLPNTNNFTDAHKLLDYLEVPSRFVGTESYYLTGGTTGGLQHPFNTISHYRVPGKININTIPPNAPNSNASLVWNALVSEEYANSALAWGVFKNSLYGAGGLPTDFANPFRPAEAANLVPGVTTPSTGTACTLLRPNATTPQQPLFDYTSSNASDNTSRSAFFRNGLRTRLGNMVTTKSSVFAGWISVGFFEVDQNDDLVLPGGNAGLEVGADSGEQVRHRGFFVFDRSIPVAYEPGKNHNIDKAILLKTIIE